MSAAESHEPREERLRVGDASASSGRGLGSVALVIGIATVILAFATPYRESLGSALLAALAVFTSTLGLVARSRARRAGERPSTAAIAAIWLGIGALAIVGISVLPALLMPTATGLR
ncbi:hypothetical protein [Agromyces bracchium]|uniref:Uncharacterized protein n=1 Tax=Agromyces bracchium TaxID=88376 RepID=A0A6I3M3D4_9MICO|nr:hypothetical protein [Agromyces bracchium]MTH67785.1 hypothetical protein [Agromyces bracchium]